MTRKGSRFAGLSRGKTAKRGQMNETETRYADQLEVMKHRGEIVRWWFEPFSLRLSRPPTGQPKRYQPDFMILYPDGRTVIVDVKGGGVNNEASLVRISCAAEQYPLWEFWLCTWKDGKWTTVEV